MQLHDTTSLRALNVPVNLTNVILYGITAGELGGKNFRSMPKYSLSSHHFHRLPKNNLDDYSPGFDEAKLEENHRKSLTSHSGCKHVTANTTSCRSSMARSGVPSGMQV